MMKRQTIDVKESASREMNCCIGTAKTTIDEHFCAAIARQRHKGQNPYSFLARIQIATFEDISICFQSPTVTTWLHNTFSDKHIYYYCMPSRRARAGGSGGSAGGGGVALSTTHQKHTESELRHRLCVLV